MFSPELLKPQLDLGLSLLTAHLLGDFVLQTSWMVREKRRFGALALHSGIVAGLSYLLCARWAAWDLAVAVWMTHACIDFLKTRVSNPRAKAFIVDQLGHLAVIVALAKVAPHWGTFSFWTAEWGASPWWIIQVFACGLILAVRVGGLLVGFWVQPYLDEIRQAASSEETRLKPMRGLTNGGRLIGQWERALIFLFVGLGQPASIGFLIAAKSIFRFGELKDRENRMEAEYITIGTLMSFGWAMVVSYPTWWLIRALM